MNEKQQRIAIAEFCGYERCPHHVEVWKYKGMKIYTASNLPDYINNRDTMISALEYLPKNKIDDFGERLLTVLFLSEDIECCHLTGCGKKELYGSPSLVFYIIKSTPQQLAEAFLRTLGLWKDPS